MAGKCSTTLTLDQETKKRLARILKNCTVARSNTALIRGLVEKVDGLLTAQVLVEGLGGKLMLTAINIEDPESTFPPRVLDLKL